MNKIYKILVIALIVLLGTSTIVTAKSLLSPGVANGLLEPLNFSSLVITVASPFTVTGTNPSVITGDGSNSYVGGNLSIGTSTNSNNIALNVNGYALFNVPFASMAENSDGTTTGSTITATTSGVFYPWTGANSIYNTLSTTSDITITATSSATSSFAIASTSSAGTYEVKFSGTLSVNTSNDIIHCSIFKNGVEQKNIKSETKLTNSGDERAISGGPAFLALVVNDVLDLRCDDETSSGKVITFDHINFGINRISK